MTKFSLCHDKIGKERVYLLLVKLAQLEKGEANLSDTPILFGFQT